MSPKAERRNNIIGRRLFWQTLVIAFILTVALSLIQMLLNYQEQLATIKNSIQQIESFQMEGISTAMWNYSMSELDAQVEGITHFPYISYAEVIENGQKISSAGDSTIQAGQGIDIPITYQDPSGESYPIGVLKIQVNRAAILTNLSQQITQILAFQALNIFIILVTFFWLIDKQVTRHLNTAARYFQTFDRNTTHAPLKLNKPPSGDELDTLVSAFNTMQANLSRESEQRFESERKLATLLSNMPGMAFQCHTDQAWTMELVSAGCYDLTGYLPEELFHSSKIDYNELILPEDREMVRETILNEFKEKPDYELAYRIRTRDHQVKWVWEKGLGLYGEDKSFPQLIEGFIIDISDKKQQEKDLEAIAAISFALRTVKTIPEMVDIILEHSVQYLQIKSARLELFDPKSKDTVIEQECGDFQEKIGDFLPSGAVVIDLLLESGKPYLDNTFGLHVDPDDPEKVQTWSVGAAPLVAHNELTGLIWFGRENPITDQEMRVLTSIAEVGANAIHRQNLFMQTEQRLLQLIGLRNIDMAINSNADLSLTFTVLLEQAITLLKVDAAQILVRNPEPGGALSQYRLGFVSQLDHETPVQIEDMSIGQAVLRGSTVSNRDITASKPDPMTQKMMDAEGFKSFFAVPLISKDRVKGILQVFSRTPLNPGLDWIEYLETLAGQAAIATGEAHLLQDLIQSNAELRLAYDQTIVGWSTALELRDRETEGHSQRVVELTIQLAARMGFTEEELVNIRRGALLHDIGKMGVPDNILLKPGKLTGDEWEIMYKHPDYAFQLLSPIHYLHPALDIPYCHHEKWDGSGYPRKLKGKEIPLAARIFAVIDVWDALTSDRPYRKSMQREEVIDYILEQSGKHFDPDVVEQFLQII